MSSNLPNTWEGPNTYVEIFVKKLDTICPIFENIYGKKWIVYWAKKFGNGSLFISIWFEIDHIVCDRPNNAVT